VDIILLLQDFDLTDQVDEVDGWDARNWTMIIVYSWEQSVWEASFFQVGAYVVIENC
jgi:hypothetical protein